MESMIRSLSILGAASLFFTMGEVAMIGCTFLMRPLACLLLSYYDRQGSTCCDPDGCDDRKTVRRRVYTSVLENTRSPSRPPSSMHVRRYIRRRVTRPPFEFKERYLIVWI
jgi:hypothetical protein